jgi:hypothetical protein
MSDRMVTTLANVATTISTSTRRVIRRPKSPCIRDPFAGACDSDYAILPRMRTPTHTFLGWTHRKYAPRRSDNRTSLLGRIPVPSRSFGKTPWYSLLPTVVPVHRKTLTLQAIRVRTPRGTPSARKVVYRSQSQRCVGRPIQRRCTTSRPGLPTSISGKHSAFLKKSSRSRAKTMSPTQRSRAVEKTNRPPRAINETLEPLLPSPASLVEGVCHRAVTVRSKS